MPPDLSGGKTQNRPERRAEQRWVVEVGIRSRGVVVVVVEVVEVFRRIIGKLSTLFHVPALTAVVVYCLATLMPPKQQPPLVNSFVRNMQAREARKWSQDPPYHVLIKESEGGVTHVVFLLAPVLLRGCCCSLSTDSVSASDASASCRGRPPPWGPVCWGVPRAYWRTCLGYLRP